MSKKLDYNTKYWNAAARKAKEECARLAKDAKRFSGCVQALVDKRNGLMADLIEFNRYTSVASAGRDVETGEDVFDVAKFDDSDAVKALPKAERQLIVKQDRVMNQLVDVLDKRICAMMKREEYAMAAGKAIAKAIAKPAPKKAVAKPAQKKASK